MLVEQIKKIFYEKNEVHFKLYALEYTIKKDEEKILIFADSYPSKKYTYNSIEELLNYYTVYNESLISQQNRINII